MTEETPRGSTPTREGGDPEARLQVVVQGLSDPQDDILVDPETLDPSLHYRFGREGRIRQARLRARGYRPVHRGDGVRLLSDDNPEDEGDPDEVIRVGDLVLMACPKAEYERRQQKAQDLANRRLENADARFKKKATLRDVMTVGRDKHD